MHTPHCPVDRVHSAIHDFLRALELEVSNNPVRLKVRDVEGGAAAEDVSVNILNFNEFGRGMQDEGLEEGGRTDRGSPGLCPRMWSDQLRRPVRRRVCLGFRRMRLD